MSLTLGNMLLLAATVLQQPDSIPLQANLGTYHAPITTSSPVAQAYFDQGLRLAYAFNHDEARRSFEQAARIDPQCAMCQWGIAYVLGPNMNAPMAPEANAPAYAASQAAARLAAATTPREQAFIAAMQVRYDVQPGADRARLDTSFAIAMRDVAKRFPRDDDAAAIFAEAMMQLSPWRYWTKERLPRRGTTELVEALEGAMARNPDHPGACHFYIHAIEAAEPARAVRCAERLAALMPGAGHIVHMPAHIYLRVGRYADAIKANEHAVHADESYIKDKGASGFYAIAYYPHNWHFLSFAATLAGRRDEAVKAAREAAENTPADVAAQAAELQLLTAFPHVTLAWFGRWNETLAEPLPRGDLRLATGLAWYARGLSYAATKRPVQARAALDSVKAASSAVTTYPGNAVLAIAVEALQGMIAGRQGNHASAIVMLQRAVKLEDDLSYMEPPFWHRPVRQLLGGQLLAAGRAADAETRFREDLARFPENVWSLRGLERSLVAQGKHEEAARLRSRIAAADKPGANVAAHAGH